MFQKGILRIKSFAFSVQSSDGLSLEKIEKHLRIADRIRRAFIRNSLYKALRAFISPYIHFGPGRCQFCSKVYTISWRKRDKKMVHFVFYQVISDFTRKIVFFYDAEYFLFSTTLLKFKSKIKSVRQLYFKVKKIQ